MTSDNLTTGNRGEDLACNFLKKQGYQILERNYRIRGGEIDIIAKHGNDLVFVEVKARFSHKFGLPVEAITFWKLKALAKSALFYIQKIKWGNKPYRFDLVSVDFANDRKVPEIEIIKNITQ